MMEVILCVLAWCLQIGITLLIALCIGALIKTAVSTLRGKKIRLFAPTLSVFVLLCALLALLSVRAPVVGPQEQQDALPAEVLSAVQSVSRDLYSTKVPLVPAYTEITETDSFSADGNTEYSVRFTIHYLYFGLLEMSYSTIDGYSIEKPLTGLS